MMCVAGVPVSARKTSRATNRSRLRMMSFLDSPPLVSRASRGARRACGAERPGEETLAEQKQILWCASAGPPLAEVEEEDRGGDRGHGEVVPIMG